VTSGDWAARLDAFSARRAAAANQPLPRLRTVLDRARQRRLEPIGTDASILVFDGPFYQSPPLAGISMGVVFVRSRDGDTGTKDPSSLGGGPIDEHLIYEGLTRAGVHAVVVGAGTLHESSFFSVWRSDLVELRFSRGLPRHPAQVVLSIDGSPCPDDVLLFNVPDVPVFVVTSRAGRDRLSPALESRPWVHAIVASSLPEQFTELRSRGLLRFCSVGGRRSASELVDAGLVQDVYLTTTQSSAGEAGTPWYVGKRRLSLEPVLEKQWDGSDGVVRFEHLLLRGAVSITQRSSSGSAPIPPRAPA
jgi:riboflavin biosynthesis pyrimidine reductase